MLTIQRKKSVMIGGAKRILGCSSRTCNEAVRDDMGLDSLQGRRDKAKVEMVATMPEHRYSRKRFVQEWNVKPRRDRQRKYWCKVVDNLFSSLGLDKAEWLEDIRKGSCSLKSFLGVAGEGIDERESSRHVCTNYHSHMHYCQQFTGKILDNILETPQCGRPCVLLPEAICCCLIVTMVMIVVRQF